LFPLRASLAAAVVAFSLAPFASVAADAVIPGTKPLTVSEPLDVYMVAGIDRFALRALAAAPAQRDRTWQRDFSSVAAYGRSIAAQRERWREIIGAVDPRVTATDFELLGTLGRDARVGESGRFNVLAVRWQVLDGLTGEGLLLQPKGQVRARAVVLPDADWTPEQFVGLTEGVAAQSQLPRRLAAQGRI
jgi:hypothetical protein